MSMAVWTTRTTIPTEIMKNTVDLVVHFVAIWILGRNHITVRTQNRQTPTRMIWVALERRTSSMRVRESQTLELLTGLRRGLITHPSLDERVLSIWKNKFGNFTEQFHWTSWYRILNSLIRREKSGNPRRFVGEKWHAQKLAACEDL